MFYRFQSVKKHFVNEWKELKLRDQTPYTAQSIISLLNGLKYFRVKVSVSIKHNYRYLPDLEILL